MKKFWLLGLFLVLVFGCKKEDSKDTLSLSGTISNIEFAGTGVEIKLYNDGCVYTTTPSISGSYSIDKVAAGEYKLTVSQQKAKGSVEKTVRVSLSQGHKEVNLLLPDPVEIFCTAHPPTSVTLKWSMSMDAGFREYKVYKGYNSALDETTGTLMHVATAATDTTFVDDSPNMTGVSPNTDYYYRVFVMDEMGKIAGSNVLHVKTDNYPIVDSLVMVTNFAGNGSLGTIEGVAWDGTGIWLAYWHDLGGFYDNNLVTLAKYNPNNFNLLDSFSFNDRYEPLGGLTFDGQYLWLQYSASGTGNNFTRKIDPASHAILNSFSTEYGVTGISFKDQTLYLNYYYSQIDKIDVNSGTLLGRYQNIVGQNMGICYGIAVRDEEIWISTTLDNANNSYLYVLHNDFSIKGVVPCSFNRTQLCFMNNQLLMADKNRVYIYQIIPKK